MFLPRSFSSGSALTFFNTSALHEGDNNYLFFLGIFSAVQEDRNGFRQVFEGLVHAVLDKLGQLHDYHSKMHEK